MSDSTFLNQHSRRSFKRFAYQKSDLNIHVSQRSNDWLVWLHERESRSRSQVLSLRTNRELFRNVTAGDDRNFRRFLSEVLHIAEPIAINSMNHHFLQLLQRTQYIRIHNEWWQERLRHKYEVQSAESSATVSHPEHRTIIYCSRKKNKLCTSLTVSQMLEVVHRTSLSSSASKYKTHIPLHISTRIGRSTQKCRTTNNFRVWKKGI